MISPSSLRNEMLQKELKPPVDPSPVPFPSHCHKKLHIDSKLSLNLGLWSHTCHILHTFIICCVIFMYTLLKICILKKNTVFMQMVLYNSFPCAHVLEILYTLKMYAQQWNCKDVGFVHLQLTYLWPVVLQKGCINSHSHHQCIIIPFLYMLFRLKFLFILSV